MFRVDPKKAVLRHVTKAGALNPDHILSPQAEAVIAAPAERTMSGTVVVGVAEVVEGGVVGVLGFAIYGFFGGPPDPAFYGPTILISCVIANVLFNLARTHRIPAYRRLMD